MEASSITSTQWSHVSEFVAERMGLHFPAERLAELRRGVGAAALDFGFSDVAECVEWLLSAGLAAPQLRTLASHLTFGETSFFRDPKLFEILLEKILPPLVHARRHSGRRLRFWSAGTCTGEEAYSLSILLHQVIPDLAEWHVTILATDINDRFLKKAIAGVYGEWSVREVSPGLKESCFRRTADGRYEVLPRFKRQVKFAQFNLVGDSYPSLATDTNAMDVILCRNVLTYFTPDQARRVVGNLAHSLVDDGWLVLSPSDGAQSVAPDFQAVHFPEAILYQKRDPGTCRSNSSARPSSSGQNGCGLPESLPVSPAQPAHRPMWRPADPPVSISPEPPISVLYQSGRYAAVVDALLPQSSEPSDVGPTEFSLLARALANQGKLTEALLWCDRWVAVNKLDPLGHYLRAVVLQELGDQGEARLALQRTLYLQPTFILAHVASGNLARHGRDVREARKHFTHAIRLLASLPPDHVLPEADGLTASRLAELVQSVLAIEAAS